MSLSEIGQEEMHEGAMGPAGTHRRAAKLFHRGYRTAWSSLPPSIAAALLLALFGLPIIALLLRTSPQLIASYIGKPLVLDALRLSLITTLLSTAIAVAFGTPLAYALARHDFPGKHLIEALIHVPLVLPPAVAGVALLMAFGRRGLFGGTLDSFGVELSFSTTAVVIAQTFVAAPFYLRSAQAGFREVDPALEALSATLGVSPSRTFWRVTLPLALPALSGGMVMAWARALGEFGATIMFAGNFEGRTQTMPLAVYSALQSNLNAALVLAVIMVVLSFVILAAIHLLTPSRRGE